MSLTRRGASCMVLCMDQVCRPGPGAAPRRRSGSWGGDQLACCAHPDVERCPYRRGHVAPKPSETVWRDWVGPFLPAGPSTEDVLRLVGSWMREDFRTARRHLIRRTIAGSVFTPRLVRWILYRWCGMRIETPHMGDSCVVRLTDLAVGTGLVVGPYCYFEGL